MNTCSYGENEPLLLVDAEIDDEDGADLNNSEKWRLLIDNRCATNNAEITYRNNNAYALTPVHESINFFQSFNNCKFYILFFFKLF